MASLTLCAWLGLPFAGYYVVRRGSTPAVRAAAAATGCGALIAYTFRDIPSSGSLQAMLGCLACWTSSIRLINLVSLPNAENDSITLPQFLSRYLWAFFPVSRSKVPRSAQQILQKVGEHLATAAAKGTVLCWDNKRLLSCYDTRAVTTSSYLVSVQYSAMYLASFFLSMFTLDALSAAVHLLSLGRYEVMQVHDWPVLSSSPRDFWGRRYNRLISTLLREAIFDPLRTRASCSNGVAALASFGVSGLIHAHWVKVGFGSSRAALCTFAFFVLHGAMCAVDAKLRLCQRLPRLAAILFTQGFLLASAPLMLGVFVASGPEFIRLSNPALPPLAALPTPTYCPR